MTSTRLRQRWRPTMMTIVALGAAFVATPARAGQSLDINGQCVGDGNNDGKVTVNELVSAVNNAVSGCQLMPITLQFRATVGDQPFACGNTYHNLGTSNTDILPADFRFYVYNIRLLTAEGDDVPVRLVQDGVWQVDNLALLDFENKTSACSQGTIPTNTAIQGLAQPGNYTGVRFTLGVPFNRNHADEATAPSPLNLSGMFWSWQDGYKFVRIDLFDSSFNSYFVHLGSTGCVYGAQPGVVASCAGPNRAEITLYRFDPSTDVIVADLAALLANSDLSPSANQPNTAPGCQSEPGDQDCGPIFQNLGINFSDGTPSPGTQKFFRVE